MFRRLLKWHALVCSSLIFGSACSAADILVPQATQLSLDNGTVAIATIVRGPENATMLIVAKPDGTAEIFYVTASPGPTPPPPPPPPPPKPTKLTIAIVEEPVNTTPQQSQVITSVQFHDAAKAKHDDLGIVTPDARDSATKEVPAKLAPFLAAAKNRKLPWIMFADPTGKIVWEGNPPASVSELIELLKKYGG
jgi:hypothetical protein